MAEEPDSIVLRFLRKLDEKLDRQQEMTVELRSLKPHMAAFLQSELSQDGSIASMLSRLGKNEHRLVFNN